MSLIRLIDPNTSEHTTAMMVAIARDVLASQGGRRFGIAKVTPGLVDVIASKVRQLSLSAQFTGTRLTDGDPIALTAEPDRLLQRLGEVVEALLKSMVLRQSSSAADRSGGQRLDCHSSFPRRSSFCAG